MNPLVSCYFACFEFPSTDAVVHIHETPEKVVTEQLDLARMKEARGAFGYIPKSISPRVLNQRSPFTVHSDASQRIEVSRSNVDHGKPNLVALDIPAGLKPAVLRLLEDYGIDRSVLFPELDGLSAHINSRTHRMTKPA